MDKEKFYSSSEIAKELGIRTKSVSHNAKQWGIGRKVGGIYLFTEDERKMFQIKSRRKYG